jgi:two-component system sensor histidine kinase ChiS
MFAIPQKVIPVTTQPAKLILVIDDDAMNREVMEAFLNAEDYRVQLAADGESGLQKAINYPPDLILLDVRMPGKSGYDICRELKAHPRTADVPVVMVTGFSGAEERKRGCNAGADGFLTRPFNIDDFLEKVGGFLESDTA